MRHAVVATNRAEAVHRRRGRPPAVEALEVRLPLATITVTGAGDVVAVDGVVTLREAILAANTNAPAGDAPAGSAGLDAIEFDIPGAGVRLIELTAALPAITEPVVLDGYTQGDAAPNTLDVGSDAVIRVQIDGTGAGNSPTAGITLDGGGSTVRGIAVGGFSGAPGILIRSGGNAVEGSFVGVAADGVTAAESQQVQIWVASGAGNRLGGTTPAARNVIAGGRSWLQPCPCLIPPFGDEPVDRMGMITVGDT